MEDDVDDLDNLFEESEDQPKENVENEASGETSEAVRVPAPKRVVKNPRLKFNAERLCGERGIPVLVDHFKNVKFKGKGHEKEDLAKLLATLEHWTHRLFPSMKFDDCLRQIEKLGKKRAVQTCLRKIRLDMPILNNDFIHDDDEENDEVQRVSGNESAPIDAFDKLLEDTPEVTSPTASTSLFSSTLVVNESTGHRLGSSLTSSLTDEQRKRMDYNRMLAAERRKAKLVSNNSFSGTVCEENEAIQSSSCDLSHKLFSSDTGNLGIDSNCHDERNALFSSNISESVKVSLSNESVEQMEQDKNLNLSPEAENENSERLKLDELMDLIEDDEPDEDSESNVSGLKCSEMADENLDVASATNVQKMTSEFQSELNLCKENNDVRYDVKSTPVKSCLNQMLNEVEKMNQSY